MSKDTIIKNYKTKKKYKKDSKRMLDKGFSIDNEMIIIGELQVEYYKEGRRKGTMDKNVKLAIIEINSKINEEKAHILRGEITQARMQFVSGLEVALNIVEKHCA